MSAPIRLQLSRAKGFNLQALSFAFNGRDAVKVTRPGPFGNPFSVLPDHPSGRVFGNQTIAVPTVEEAVACFAEMLTCEGETAEAIRALLPSIRGKNLACWCKIGVPCHADVLLDLANKDQA